MKKSVPGSVLVTGGAGFVGSHLVENLLAQDYTVYVIDNLSTGSMGNMAQARAKQNFHFIQGSVLNTRLVAEVVTQVDVIYHLAASVGVKLVIDKLIESIDNNVRGTESVLSAASQAGKKVLLTSTSEVYGRGDRQVFTEQDDLAMGPTTKGRWSYACSKALDEYLAFAYRAERGVPVTVARLFNTVGERQSSAYGMVLPTFVRQALEEKPLTVHGDGQQSRCFCHVSDVVSALRQLMETPESDGEVYNVGNAESVTMGQLADRVIELTGTSSTKVLVPYEEAYPNGFEDITKRVPDISKIQALLNWQPTLGLDDIIVRMRDYELSPREKVAYE